jgi:hypothetical protein
MNSSAEATALTDILLEVIRLQRHLGVRVLISTQEPTISPAPLDLSSITIVHRFTSPEWFRALKGHLTAAAWDLIEPANEENSDEETSDRYSSDSDSEKAKKGGAKRLFAEIIGLGVGEALLFAPTAITGLEKTESGRIVMKRLTEDGGRSVMALPDDDSKSSP